MSFIGSENAKGWEAGYFLKADELCVRETMTIAYNHANVQTAANGGKYVPAGSAIPSNDGNAVGILYEDVDVTNGSAPGSVVTEGTVYLDKLSLEAAAKSALTKINQIATSPSVTRPY